MYTYIIYNVTTYCYILLFLLRPNPNYEENINGTNVEVSKGIYSEIQSLSTDDRTGEYTEIMIYVVETKLIYNSECVTTSGSASIEGDGFDSNFDIVRIVTYVFIL